MVGEGGKLNLNWLLAGEDPRKLETVEEFFWKIADSTFRKARDPG